MRQTFLGQMVQTATCPTCNGRGETIANPCKTCHGGGLERKTVKKKVQIPAGVDAGTQIRLTGRADPASSVVRMEACSSYWMSRRTSSSNAWGVFI